MALNPIVFTERVVRSFLRYQLTAYPFADERLHAQMRRLLSLDETRQSPLLKGPYLSLSRPFRQGAAVDALVREGVFHPHMRQRIPAEITHVYGHQEDAIRAIHAGRTTLVSTGTGSGKTECFLYPIVSKCLQLRDQGAPPGISAVIVYPMNALAEDQLGRLRSLLAGTGVTFGMYVGKTPDRRAEVAGIRLRAGASRADYEAKLAEVRRERRSESVYPPEEACSREEMRTPGGQPRILLTNVKQLELLLTRQRDVELFAGARLDFLVFDEAHTFTGAHGAETACLIRRLRAYCGREAQDSVCVATSATIVDREDPDAARDFASRFFGVAEDSVATVGETYEPEVWTEKRTMPPKPGKDASVPAWSSTRSSRIGAAQYQVSSSGPEVGDRCEQLSIHEELEEALQKLFRRLWFDTPFLRDLAHCGVAALADPLGDEFRLFLITTVELRPGRTACLRKVALLYFQIAVHPVLSENFALGIVQNPLAPQVVENTGDTVAQVLSRHPKSKRVLLDPGQPSVEPFVLHLHSAPHRQAL